MSRNRSTNRNSNNNSIDTSEHARGDAASTDRSTKPTQRPRKKPGNRGPKMDPESQRALNDISWYTHYPDLVNGSASIPYILGMQTKWSLTDVPGEGSSVIMNQSSPGLMAFRTNPAYGISTSMDSPLNQAAQEIYGFIRLGNSRTSSYDAADIMTYLIAWDSIYMLTTNLIRAYGMLNVRTPDNTYFPDTFISAMGLKPSDAHDNASKMYYGINEIISMLQGWGIPTGMDIFARHQWLYKTYYTDSQTSKAQSYMFVPNTYYEWAGAGSEYSTSTAVLKQIPYNNLMGVEGYVHLIKTLINNIRNDSDCIAMHYDILAWYGSSGLYQVEPMPLNYVTQGTFAPEVLMQIQNMTICGLMDPIDSNFNGNITHDGATGIITYNPISQRSDDFNISLYMTDRLITIPIPNANPSINMVATRFTNVCEWKNRENHVVGFHEVGSEFVSAAIIYKYRDVNGSWEVVESSKLRYVNNDYTLARGGLAYFNSLTDVTSFNMHPCIIGSYSVTVGDETTNPTIRLFDLDNFAVLNKSELARMHQTAIRSMFSIKNDVKPNSKRE